MNKIIILVLVELGRVKIALFKITVVDAGGGKRPPFIPLPSDFSVLANFGTNL